MRHQYIAKHCTPSFSMLQARPAEGEESDDDGNMVEEENQPEVMKYEQAKLRWYFAVATFDSPSTASSIYEQCDGLEYQHSGITFDLRVVDDDESFFGLKVRLQDGT
jgi:hypothetical protein